MKSLRLLVLTAFLSSPAWAVVSVVQNNVQVPTTGSLTPFDFLNDGTNSWPLIDIFDGTTHGTFNADGGLATHLNNTSIAVTGTFWQTTQPVSAASLPLPTGAATSALQTTINTTLGSPMQNSGGTVTVTQATGSNLHVNVDNTNANGSALSANSAPVVIASDQAAVAAKAASGAFVAGSIADLAHGQGTMAASVPVAIASNQSAVPVSGTFWQTTQPISAASLPLPSGAATATNQTNVIGSASAGTAAVDSLLGGAIFNSTPITLANGNQAALQADANGYLNVHIQAGAGSGGTAITDNGAFTQGTTSETPIGCLYTSSYTGATSGHSTIPQCDVNGHLITNATPDASATGNITAADSASSSATWANGQTVLSGAPTTNSVVSASVSTINGMAIQVSGTWQGTLVTEGSVDGSNWTAVPVKQRGTNYWQSSFVSGSSGTTGDFIADVNAAGLKGLRVRATAWTSGTATVAFLQTANIPTLSANANIGSANGAPLDPCYGQQKSGAAISLTASGQVITGASGKKTYICSIDIVSATAQNIALVEGTGTVCATNIFGLAGGTTAATGWNLAANGGETKGAGIGTVFSPSADANATAANVCLLLSGTGQTSGQIEYVQQ